MLNYGYTGILIEIRAHTPRDSFLRGYYPGFEAPIGTFNPRSIMILGVKISLSGNFL